MKFLLGFVSSLSEMKNMFPKEDDISGAKSAIIRLQETFVLPPRKIMDGLEHNEGLMPKLGESYILMKHMKPLFNYYTFIIVLTTMIITKHKLKPAIFFSAPLINLRFQYSV